MTANVYFTSLWSRRRKEINFWTFNPLRGAGGGILDHHLVIAKIRCLKRWTGRVVNTEERFEIKVSELRKATC